MRIKLLGAAAGGGFPQWNCACKNCDSARRHENRPRTQSQLALSADGSSWFLINASPDLRVQIESHSELHPAPQEGTIRHTPISAVVLTNGDLDHVLGLLLMRESQPLHIYATSSVRRILTEDNSLFKMLSQKPGQTQWTDIIPGQSFELTSIDGERSGLICMPISIAARFPIYVSATREAELSPQEAVLAVMIEDTRTGKKVAYLPGIPHLDETWLKLLEKTDLVLCDGTCWSNDEIQKLTGAKRSAREMGHIPISGPEGSIELLSRLKRPRKVYTHINNTNPVLNEKSPEHGLVLRSNLEVGYDGMEFRL